MTPGIVREFALSRFGEDGVYWVVIKSIPTLLSFVLLVACSHSTTQTTSESTGAASTPAAANYTPRIGVAVSTGSRLCVAIQNGTLQPGSAITLVSPLAPQSFQQAEVSGPATSACPVSKELTQGISSFDLKLNGGTVQKLSPLIAVVGPPTAFSNAANGVAADLDQNGKTESFRACSASDGYHLTAWGGAPLTGTLVWHGYYYEPDNPGAGPPCTPKETTAP